MVFKIHQQKFTVLSLHIYCSFHRAIVRSTDVKHHSVDDFISVVNLISEIKINRIENVLYRKKTNLAELLENDSSFSSINFIETSKVNRCNAVLFFNATLSKV